MSRDYEPSGGAGCLLIILGVLSIVFHRYLVAAVEGAVVLAALAIPVAVLITLVRVRRYRREAAVGAVVLAGARHRAAERAALNQALRNLPEADRQWATTQLALGGLDAAGAPISTEEENSPDTLRGRRRPPLTTDPGP